MKGIITADWHLRRDPPRCRLDEDWLESQARVVGFIKQEAINRGVALYIAGDIFHRSVVAIEILEWVIKMLKGVDTFILPGQHCLPYNSWSNVNQSSYGVLRHYCKELMDVDNVQASPFGQEDNFKNPKAEIVFTHQYVYKDKKDAIIIDGKPIGKSADNLLKEYPKAQWIFTGDNHHGFHYIQTPKHQHVINPGCITRQASDFKDYKPVVYYVDTEQGIVEPIELPDTEPVVTDQYIKDEEARNDRIESFISTIQKQGKVSLNFIDNLQEKGRGLKGEDLDVLDEIIEEVV